MGILTRGYTEWVMSLGNPATQAADAHVAAERLPAGPGWWLKDIRAKLLVADLLVDPALGSEVASEYVASCRAAVAASRGTTLPW